MANRPRANLVAADLAADQEIQDVHAAIGGGRIQLRIPALRANDRNEALVLHIEELG